MNLPIDLLHKVICCHRTVDIAEKRLDGCVDFASLSLGIEKDLSRAVLQLDVIIFQALIIKRIDVPTGIKWIEGTDKNNNRRVQAIVVRPCGKQVSVHHRLIVARTLREAVPLGLSHLHLDVIDRALSILHIDIHADALAPVNGNKHLLRTDIGQIFNLDVQNALKHLLTDAFSFDNQLEHIVVTDRQVFPILHPNASFPVF